MDITTLSEAQIFVLCWLAHGKRWSSRLRWNTMSSLVELGAVDTRTSRITKVGYDMLAMSKRELMCHLNRINEALKCEKGGK